jgi:hypothetical protein
VEHRRASGASARERIPPLKAGTRPAAALILLAGAAAALEAQSVTEGSGAPPARKAVAAAYAPAQVRLDGVLDEDVWRTAPAATDFVQAEPDEGRPASERTVVRVAFDAGFLYIGARLYDSRPDQLVVSDIRKDFRTDNQDTFEVILDTFHDRRSGYVFITNPAGARADQQVANEGRETNASWDAPWSVRTQRTDSGWTVEMAIPLSALRSAADADTWGVNFSRRIRRNNEVVYWSPIPRAYTLARLSLAGDLTGMVRQRSTRDLRLTPHVLAQTVREADGSSFDQTADAGLTARLGLTRGLTLDLTVNPDFAQAEIDEQQVNLTQFSQFFPEKRDFFLENSGQFYVGDTPRNRRIALMPMGDDNLLLFFSRRMGLGPDGRPIGIDGGVRLTGHAAGIQVGALALRTRDRDSIEGSDYVVARLRRNVGQSSDVGAVFMMRSTVHRRSDYNRLYGADATFRLPGRVDWTTFLVSTETDSLSGERYAFQTSFLREGNLFHAKAGLLSIGEDFNNELGFVRRTGVREWSLDTGLRPRPAWARERGVREIHPHIGWSYYTDQSGRGTAKRLHNGVSLFLANGGFGEISVNPRGETIYDSLALNPSVTPLPPGSYDWIEYMMFFETDASRPITLGGRVVVGGLWNGSQRTAGVTLTLRPSYRARASIGLQRTAVDLAGPGQEFGREIWTLRGNYSFNTNMFVDALAQYDAVADRLSANLRFNLIHRPLSNLYVVLNEQQPRGRSVILKFTRMLAL